MNGRKPCNKKKHNSFIRIVKRVAQRTAQHKKKNKGWKKRGKLQRMREGKWENNNDRKNKCNKNCFYNSTMFLITFLLLDCYMKASLRAFPLNCLIFGRYEALNLVKLSHI